MNQKNLSDIKSKEFRGIPIRWIERRPSGSAKGVIFWVHGFPDDADTWRHQLPAFEQDYIIVAPFLPALDREVGRLPEGRRMNLDSVVLDYLQILREVLGDFSGPIFLVGHDIGGAVAWRLCELLGPEVRGLITINSISLEQLILRFKRSTRQLRKSWYMFFFQIPVVSPLWISIYGSYFRRRIKEAEGAELPALDHRHIWRALRFYKNASREFFSPRTVWPQKRAQKLSAPLLSLWGKDEAFLELPTLEEAEAFSTSVTVRVLEGGHWIHQSKADQVNRLIRAFVESGTVQR